MLVTCCSGSRARSFLLKIKEGDMSELQKTVDALCESIGGLGDLFVKMHKDNVKLFDEIDAAIAKLKENERRLRS